MHLASPERRPNPFLVERPDRSAVSGGCGSRSSDRTARGPDCTSSPTVGSSGSSGCGGSTGPWPVSSGRRCCARTPSGADSRPSSSRWTRWSTAPVPSRVVAATDAVAVRCRGPYPVRRAAYEELARVLGRARPPAGVVFEASSVTPHPCAIVRPASLVDEWRGSASGTAGAVEVVPLPRAPEPPPGLVARSGHLVAGSTGATASRDLVPPSPPPLFVLLGPSGWLGWQTFWVAGANGPLWAARRFRFATVGRAEVARRWPGVGRTVAFDWERATGTPWVPRPGGWRSRRAWERRSVAGMPPTAWRVLSGRAIADTTEARWLAPADPAEPPAGHAIVFGTSGAGKTTYLAHRAAMAISRGERVVAIDLHGDLAPAIAARLAPAAVDRLVAVDATLPPVPGIAALAGVGDDDRAAGLLVAAVKRLSADGGDLYWGFRLERIYDSMVRLVQESGGSILDLYDLLTSAERRDVARLATHRPELAGFLEELAPVVRRNPEFLWPAATRLAKVALVPALAELLAPPDGGLPLEDLIADGRSVLVRLPFARLGPEASALAATFVLARVFLGVAGRDRGSRSPVPVLLVLDEVHGFSPRLVAEVLAESRKFGVRALLATQYPDRLAPEVRSAAAGASAACVVFRVPPPSAAEAGTWLGLPRDESERTLPTLAPGRGVELDPDRGGWRYLEPVAEPPPTVGDWPSAVRHTQTEFPPRPRVDGPGRAEDPIVERLLLTVLAAEESGRPLADGEVIGAAVRAPGSPVDAAALADRWRSIAGQRWLAARDAAWHLTPAGERWLGLGAPTGATRESAEHRRLLLRTFRVFARHGVRLEIVRQGRFDTTLPDARYRQLPGEPMTPADLAAAIDRARGTWPWRYFGGRDVHVEAEVSGALRPERIRHGWAKARDRGAAVLFVVGDAARSRRVRRALERAAVPRGRAWVWTLAPNAPPKY